MRAKVWKIWRQAQRLILLVLACALVAPAMTANAQGGQAFSVSPPLIELAADPGQTVTASIKFTNIANNDELVDTEVNAFAAKNENGEPSILFDNQEGLSSLQNWVVKPQPFNIKANETKTIDFKIVIPTNAEPGGRYAVIRFVAVDPTQTPGQVALTGSIGTLVLLNVSGDVRRDASVAEFYSTSVPIGDKSSGASLFQTGPIGFVARIRNSGNVHIKPSGTITIHNMFGQTVAKLPVNGDVSNPSDPPKSVLPQSVRRFEEVLGDQWLFGHYTATLALQYADGKAPLQASITFWVIPYTLIIGILLGLVVMFFVLRWLVRRYNAHIIRKARKF